MSLIDYLKKEFNISDEDLEMVKKEPSLSSISFMISEVLYSPEYRNKKSEVDLRDLKSPIYKIPEWTDDKLKELGEYLKSDSNFNLADFHLDGFIVKPIEYEPFVAEFESSGRVILENDLRDFFKEEDYNINSAKGIIQTMKHYADQGMLHGFVGNSCPTFILNKNKGEIIVGMKWNEKTGKKIMPKGFKEWGWVCTDLWWYSVVDYEKFKKISGLSDDEINNEYNVLELERGTWRLEHYYGISSNGYHEIPYARLTKTNNG